MKLTFGCCDLALDPITFTSELDLDMPIGELLDLTLKIFVRVRVLVRVRVSFGFSGR